MQANQILKTLLAIIIFSANTVSFAQSTPQEVIDSTIRAYIAENSPYAVAEMERTGIPASVTLAQGICESRFGTSNVAQNAHNHFGIKCYKAWEGKRYFHKDDEYKKGKLVPSCFRYYVTTEASYRDHSDFLIGRPWYDHLFKLQSNDYKGWALGLRKAGYAHAVDYEERLFKYINKFELNTFDKKGYKLDRKKLKIETVEPSDSVQFVDEIATESPEQPKTNPAIFIPKTNTSDTTLAAARHHVPINAAVPLDTAITFTEPKLQKESQKKGKSEKANEKDDAVSLAQNKDEIDKKNALKPEKSSLLLLGHRPPLATPKKDAAIKPTEKEAEPVEIVAKSEKVDKMEKNGAEKDKKPIYIPPAAKKDSTSTEIVVGKAVNSPATPVTEVKNKQHRVAIGDNPYKIARLYNISLEKLYELNNLPSGSPIAAGQILRVE